MEQYSSFEESIWPDLTCFFGVTILADNGAGVNKIKNIAYAWTKTTQLL